MSLADLYEASCIDSQKRSPSKQVCNMTWDEVYVLCNKLADQIRPNLHQFACIKAIANGGIVPASILAYILNLDLQIIDHPPNDYRQEGFLLLDDVFDTGQTIKEYIADEKWLWQGTATLILKPWCPYKPIYLGKETDSWIIFPWEKKN